ncbi:Zinc finger A20 and AN1 domain-containing stress-associated protein 7 [Smittium culicis]|uniref:Zinc finger A20 and AN1 domain-containing stress-associated protein 7 n=1 Tax=Smittium culicis TaxID=133412 RepID=A0A1R1XKV2_9FUNG|nr:Zinc finger A20 and AN1 domain-containing stress-associated protein 7 [Smittium culicis]
MEKNSDSQVPPEFCANNCGFYGNPIYKNMCSKCFKEKENEAAKMSEAMELPTPQENIMTLKESIQEIQAKSLELQHEIKETPVPQEAPVKVELAPSSPPKKVQTNKGRCFICKGRIQLVKQTTNKCRCEKVFCDTHKFPDQHSCEFDFILRDRKELEKKNPKINDQPKGGRTFNRII